MALDITSLGELLRKERASPSLQPVSVNLYEELQGLLKTVEKEYPPYSRERENLQNLVIDIFNSREKKLVLNAISFARAGEDEDPDNATPEEREFFGGLVSLLRERRRMLSGKDGLERGEDPVKAPRTGEAKPVRDEGQAGKKSDAGGKRPSASGFITLRILEELPPIVGSDAKTYGSFKPDDIVALPERNAKVFVKQGYGEPIDIDL